MNTINKISILVREYDEAIEFYTKALGFVLLQDTRMSETKRWVEVAPSADAGCILLLAKAASPEQERCIGNQTGGRVFIFINTTDIEADLKRFRENGVTIVRELSTEPYGKVLVFADLYGNKFDLIQPPVSA